MTFDLDSELNLAFLEIETLGISSDTIENQVNALSTVANEGENFYFEALDRLDREMADITFSPMPPTPASTSPPPYQEVITPEQYQELFNDGNVSPDNQQPPRRRRQPHQRLADILNFSELASTMASAYELANQNITRLALSRRSFEVPSRHLRQTRTRHNRVLRGLRFDLCIGSTDSSEEEN